MITRDAILFLQGPASPLFMRIAEHLEAAGRSCFRINLHAGDSLFWRRRGGAAYRGRPEDWGEFVRSFMDTHGIGAIILLGEERPYHAEAIRIAHARGIDVYVIEMGYLRPDWVTIERDGMSSNSRFPNDPTMILAAARQLPEVDRMRRYHQTFLAEALYDLAYNLPSVFFCFLYPHYRRHSVFHPLAEYAGWIVQLATQKIRNSRAQAMIIALKEEEKPWFIYPLQLETDFQLRAHSPYHSQKQAIAEILTSFAEHAPADARLAVKVHPLDNGLISWRRFIHKLAEKLGIARRVLYFGGGDLAALISGASGIVTVNSTAALHGLSDGIPAKVLGTAIYDIAGMTDQGPLELFWQAPHRPDPELTAAFYRLLAASIQVRGNFNSQAGTSAAAKAVAARILDGSVNLPGGDSGHVPRRKPPKFPPDHSFG
ncbi:capsular biosynthesis protein [Rhizobium pusense]|uniref:capsule biosynthesis protein n=2 Tax=Agrobacterium pusense TaxID=648995 RepID=UPI00244D7154|nr:capsular biosynthesis protein [Agrobacterium pusense]MDH1098428.1 capsular biosynthesis protein [Agrobacterium pusense]MDH1114538.1 capsular biosynthesis protein [Agrobacterium pusense]MDH2195698.1 capsular biosynthesis protein [Agrobacterium pusense]